MKSESVFRIEAKGVYENELRQNAVSTKKGALSTNDVSTLQDKNFIETRTPG